MTSLHMDTRPHRPHRSREHVSKIPPPCKSISFLLHFIRDEIARPISVRLLNQFPRADARQATFDIFVPEVLGACLGRTTLRLPARREKKHICFERHLFKFQ